MKILKLMLAIAFVAFLFSGCKYNFIIPEEVPVISPDDPDAPEVSFATDIAPIFNDNNNCTACHKTGGQRPDLSTANAYASLSSTRYINTSNPAESLIYKHPHPDEATHMHKKLTQTQAALILLWIQQGAKNN